MASRTAWSEQYDWLHQPQLERLQEQQEGQLQQRQRLHQRQRQWT
jgi:hypothetical protein